jgi:hypothetical protein
MKRLKNPKALSKNKTGSSGAGEGAAKTSLVEEPTWDQVEVPVQKVPDSRVSTRSTSPIVYDEALFERAVTQWQFGDWEGLVCLDRNAIESHPERVKLALMIAVAHLQVGSQPESRSLFAAAVEWGCTKKSIAQFLVSGAHNSMGKAAVILGDEQRALAHFDCSIRTAVSSGAANLLLPARITLQLSQLKLTGGQPAFLPHLWSVVTQELPAKWPPDHDVGLQIERVSDGENIKFDSTE